VRRLLALVMALALAPSAALAAEPPAIDAPEAIVVEATTGDVVYEKDPDQHRPIASTTKLMTALLTLEDGNLDDVVQAPRYDALPAESVLGLIPGEKITVQDLMRGLLMYSANDAAVALAVHVGGSVPSFVRMMNRRAEELGLEDTHYANPVGLDEEGNYSTARDLATLTRVLRKNRFFRRTVNTNDLTLRSGATERTLSNRNTLLFDYPWVDGVKTGYTSQAGNVLVASGRKRGVPIISVVMGAASKPARDEESVELLNYGFSQYRVRRAVIEDQRLASIPIAHRAGAELPAVADRTLRRVVRKDERFEREVHVPDEVEGPIDYGEKIGEVVISLRGEPVAKVPLRAALEVPKAGIGRRTQDFLTQPWMLVVLGAVLVIASLVMRRRSPPPRRDRAAEEPAS
jgi:serine-type D-Ala-D-Ala carboxypeptidase (penicillin-binding protein 5/6)